ncbi:MAG: HD domain-containing protein [Candidatus Promineifilaceae bacterium]
MKPEWRSAVRKAMRQAANAEMGPSSCFNYRWEHVEAVVTLAMRLADLTGADPEIVEAAAWLHDVTKQDGEEHAETGARFAARFLPQTDFPEEKIPAVVRAIAEHMVLWDADKLSKLGLTAAFHFTGMILAGDGPVTTRALLADLADTGWQPKAVASMHTEPAKQAAETRLAAYERLLIELDRELNGRDL